MGKFDGVLLATDYDDTYSPDSGVIPPSNLAALEYFKGEGGIFTVATGRAHRTFAPFLHLAPVNAPVILSNGAQLYDFSTNELLMSITLPVSVREDLSELLTWDRRLSMEAYHGEDLYIWNRNEWIDFHLRKTGLSGEDTSLDGMPLPWGKAILENDHEILLAAQEYILSRWSDRYEAIFSNFHMLEITAKGATKGGMVTELCRRLEIARENVYCVGDNQNDIPMLSISAIPFAPANCAQAVKDWGAVLLPSCEEGTIAAAITIIDGLY